MAQKHDSEQGGHIAHAENLADNAGRQRHRREPEHPHGHGEQIDRKLALRRQQQRGNGDGAQEIYPRESQLLAPSLSGHAGEIGAEDVEQPDEGEGDSPGPRAKPEIGDIGREMHRNERHMESAYEKTGVQQQIATVGECFAQGASHRLISAGRIAGRGRGLLQQQGGWNDDKNACGEDHQRRAPAIGGDQSLTERRKHHLAERSRRGANAERHGAALGAHRPGHNRQRDGKSGKANADPRYKSGKEIKLRTGPGAGHAPDAERINHGARHEHP